MSQKIWVTKYALTTGIVAAEAEIQGGMASVSSLKRSFVSLVHFHGKDWHLTPEDAEKRAEVMRLKKIAGLEKQLKELRGVRIQVVTP